MKPEIPPAIPALTPRARILFQGDSITDGNRGRNSDPNHILGHGYVFLIAARWGAAYPEKDWTFLNRGVSGNTVADLSSRWQADTLDLQPDLLSILVGVNDQFLVAPINQIKLVRLSDASVHLTRSAARSQLDLCRTSFPPDNPRPLCKRLANRKSSNSRTNSGQCLLAAWRCAKNAKPCRNLARINGLRAWPTALAASR